MDAIHVVEGTLESLEVVNFDEPDETRKFRKGKVDIAKIDGVRVGRAVYEPGWRWSTSLKPQQKTEWCEAQHFQYHLSGRLHIETSDGRSKVVEPGEVSLVPCPHDAWVVGKEPVVVIDFQGMAHYAEPRRAAPSSS